jgi:hypothetical protein
MRLATLFCVLLALAGINVAQDTNFSTGPQYLVNGASPLFLQSIATPSLSLSTPPSTLSASAADALFQIPTSAGIPLLTNLSRIYWGTPAPDAQVADRVTENVDDAPSNGARKVAKMNVSEIIISSVPSLIALPASILDTGVTGMTSAQSLRIRGFGVPLGDTAVFWKTHKPHASRIYTNADVQRLHKS